MTYEIKRGERSVASISTWDGTVKEAPPELRWMVGQTIKTVLDWCMAKGLSWTLTA